MKKGGPWLFKVYIYIYMVDDTTQLSGDYVINHYEDPGARLHNEDSMDSWSCFLVAQMKTFWFLALSTKLREPGHGKSTYIFFGCYLNYINWKDSVIWYGIY